MSHRSGILFVLSAPSGGGKSTLLRWLAEKGCDDFIYSISCTTRTPRPGEVDGEHYHFLSHEEFRERIAAGDFLEHAHVHGNHYGTLRRTVVEALDAGRDLLLDVDTQGAAQIRANVDARLHAALVDIFLMPPSMTVLEHRLRKRGTESAEQLALRLNNAAVEMADWNKYRYAIISGDASEDFENFRAIMRTERMRCDRLTLGF
jgi:guanylate kinase